MGAVDWGDLGGAVLDDLFAGETAAADFGDRYQIGDPLGEGGQGVVYRAWDRNLKRPVAIKHLHGTRGRGQLAEANLISQLAHPAIPQVYDEGVSPDGSRYVVMQLVDGLPLGRWLAKRQPSLTERLHIFRRLAGALGHAHDRGIVHRDLKPGNVLVTASGEPYLVDWGLAATGDPRAICGTPIFAAPEQLDGQVADRRADVYALAVLLYYLLCEAFPFTRVIHDFAEFRRQRAGLGTIALSKRRPDLPRYLSRIVDIGMSPQPAARYPHMRAMLDDLDSAEQSGRVAQDKRLHPSMATAFGIPVLALVLGIAIGFFGLDGWRSPAPDATVETPAVVETPAPVGEDPDPGLGPADLAAVDGVFDFTAHVSDDDGRSAETGGGVAAVDDRPSTADAETAETESGDLAATVPMPSAKPALGDDAGTAAADATSVPDSAGDGTGTIATKVDEPTAAEGGAAIAASEPSSARRGSAESDDADLAELPALPEDDGAAEAIDVSLPEPEPAGSELDDEDLPALVELPRPVVDEDDVLSGLPRLDDSR